MDNPRSFPSTDYINLSSIVSRGEFHIFRNKHDIPESISRAGGFPSSDEFQATVLMAATTSCNPPNIGGITPASSSPIYRLTVIRAHQHNDGPFHANSYDLLIFADKKNNILQKKATDKDKDSYHFVELMKDSGLDIPIYVYKLPQKEHGNLSELAKSNVTTHFSTRPSNKKA